MFIRRVTLNSLFCFSGAIQYCRQDPTQFNIGPYSNFFQKSNSSETAVPIWNQKSIFYTNAFTKQCIVPVSTWSIYCLFKVTYQILSKFIYWAIALRRQNSKDHHFNKTKVFFLQRLKKLTCCQVINHKLHPTIYSNRTIFAQIIL